MGCKKEGEGLEGGWIGRLEKTAWRLLNTELPTRNETIRSQTLSRTLNPPPSKTKNDSL